MFKAANAGISPLLVVVLLYMHPCLSHAHGRVINPPLQLSAKIGLMPCFVALLERNPHRRLPNRIQFQTHLMQIQVVADCQVAALLYLPSCPLRLQLSFLQRCSRLTAVLILLRISILRNSPQRGRHMLLRRHQVQLLGQQSRDLLLDVSNSTPRKFNYKKPSATQKARAHLSANSLFLLGPP